MTVDPAAAGIGSEEAVSGTHGMNALGGEAFLKLLVTKLKNQDPTNPQSDTEFIAQLAQFSALEQLTSINRAVTALSAVMIDAAAQRSKAAQTPLVSERMA